MVTILKTGRSLFHSRRSNKGTSKHENQPKRIHSSNAPVTFVPSSNAEHHRNSLTTKPDEPQGTDKKQDKPQRIHSTLTVVESKHNSKKNNNATRPRSRNPAFVVPLLTSAESKTIVEDCGELGIDPSSTMFANRTKNIAFVIALNGQWFQINQNFFNQAEEYNDFSGGYRRFYDELPRSFIQNTAAQKLLTKFKDLNKIEDGELILVQVQSSNITPEDEGKCLTGQGIHSDGADRAMLICLERDNVKGAKSSVYEDAHGHRPIISPRVIKEGQVLFWKDNEIYHYVEPAELENKIIMGKRTVMIAHYPAMQYITGEPNPNNTLPPSGFHPPHVKHPKL